MNQKRLLLVDPDCVMRSPSMKGVLRSLPQLHSEGFVIEAWCWDADNSIGIDHVTQLPNFGAQHLKLLQAFVFSVQVTLLYFWRFHILGSRRPDVIYTIMPYLPFCDVAHTQFSPWDYERRMRIMGHESIMDRIEAAAYWLYRLWTDAFLAMTSAKTIVAPSRAVALDLKTHAPGHHIEVLANSFDPLRFNPGVRLQHRAFMRAKFGFQRDDCVFIFVSMGHYRRKGFFLACAALALLRPQCPQIKFLIVGGHPNKLDTLRKRLDHLHPDWRDWIQFVGMVQDTEAHFAAADAFLYPSWSEALALVEIEAAECALPLFLTPHHGSEMVLEDGVNGRSISFNPTEIAPVLKEFVTGDWRPTSTNSRCALDASAFAARLTALLLEASTGANISLKQHV